MATFSCWFENDEKTSDDGLQIAIYKNNNVISHTIRKNWTGEAGLYETNIHTQAIVFITTGDVVSVRANRLGNDRIRIANRSLIMMHVGGTVS